MSITFKSFLVEENEKNDAFDIEHGLEQIALKCKPFLELSDDLPLYRGIAGPKLRSVRSNGGIGFSVAPENRSPRDSDEWFNFMFNSIMEIAYNIHNIRKLSIFATGDYEMSKLYGNVVFVFPAGNCELLYSSVIKDSLEDYHHPFFTFWKKYAHAGTNFMVRTLFDLLNTTFNGDTSKFVDNSRSTIDLANSYLKKYYKNVRYKGLYTAAKEIGRNLYKSTNSFEEAIKSKNEILIYKSSGYYFVPLNIAKNYYKSVKGSTAKTNEDVYKVLLEGIAKF